MVGGKSARTHRTHAARGANGAMECGRQFYVMHGDPRVMSEPSCPDFQIGRGKQASFPAAHADIGERLREAIAPRLGKRLQSYPGLEESAIGALVGWLIGRWLRVTSCPMRLATWNINSIRARVDRAIDFLDRSGTRRPRAPGDQVQGRAVPARGVRGAGYEVAHVGWSQWNGVAIVSRVGMDDVETSFPSQPGSATRRWSRRARSARRAPGCACGACTSRTAAPWRTRTTCTSSPGWRPGGPGARLAGAGPGGAGRARR